MSRAISASVNSYGVEDRGSLGQTSQSLDGLSTDGDDNTDASTEPGSPTPSAADQVAGQPVAAGEKR